MKNTFEYYKKIAHETLDKALELGWKLDKMHLASTNSIYLEIFKEKDNKQEYVMIRFSNHEKVYKNYFKMYSISPTEYSFNEVIEILSREFGLVGDVFELEKK